MKITDVKVTVIEVESPMGGHPGRSSEPRMQQLNFVQIFTDEGIEGNYLAIPRDASGRGMADTIVEVYKPMLVGRDPFDREAIWDSIVNRHTGQAFVSMNALGALDVALWDIAGKATGLPICKLLGGYREKIRAYASLLAFDSLQDCADYARELVANGYTAIKLHPRGGAKEHVEACRVTREAVGDKVDLMLDSMCRYDRREALWVGRELEKLNFYWYEEPLWNSDLEGNKELSQLLDIPIAATEALYTIKPDHFVPFIADHIVDIIRPNAERGITLTKKVADMCDAFGMKAELHSWGYAARQFANLHVMGAIRNCDFFESMEPGELYDVCVKNTIEIDKEGFVHMPTKPGLGLEFDLDEIKRCTVLTV
jgi:L-alanine-DL-glutamate epimerase-like enolase superfamily enzyme